MKPRERRRQERWNNDKMIWMVVAVTLVSCLLTLIVMMCFGAIVDRLI